MTSTDETTPVQERGFLSRYAGLPEVSWGRPVTIALGFVIAISIAFVGIVIVLGFDPDGKSQAALLAQQLAVVIAFSGTALGFALAGSGGDLPKALGSLGFRRVAIGMLGLAALAWLAYSFTSLTAGSLLDPKQDPVTDDLGTDTGSIVSVVATGLLVVPGAAFAEELFFRGFMFAGMRNAGASLWVAAALSSAIWASLHLGAGNIGVVLILAAFGLVLAWLYERSGSLWVPIAAHALNNTVAFIALLLS